MMILTQCTIQSSWCRVSHSSSNLLLFPCGSRLTCYQVVFNLICTAFIKILNKQQNPKYFHIIKMKTVSFHHGPNVSVGGPCMAEGLPFAYHWFTVYFAYEGLFSQIQIQLTLVSGSRSITWSILAVFSFSPVLDRPCISPMRMRKVAAAASFFATFLLEASATGNSLPLSITCIRNLTGKENIPMRHSDLSIHD